MLNVSTMEVYHSISKCPSTFLLNENSPFCGRSRWYFPSTFTYSECTSLCTYLTSIFFTSTSAEAATRIYNLALRIETNPTYLRSQNVWDAFFLHSLLRDSDTQNTSLKLPHHGTNNERFNAALDIRNTRMAGTGQELWAHACDLCMKQVVDNHGVPCKLVLLSLHC